MTIRKPSEKIIKLSLQIRDNIFFSEININLFLPNQQIYIYIIIVNMKG